MTNDTLTDEEKRRLCGCRKPGTSTTTCCTVNGVFYRIG